MNLDVRDEFWMRQALQLAARAAEQGEVPVGALVVLDDECIGSAWNQPILSHDPSAHAEIVALRRAGEQQANYRLPGATLYVTIEPCTMCAGAIIHSRIRRLVYGAPEPKAGVIHSQAHILEQPYFNHRVEVTAGVLEEDATALMQEFFRERRRSRRKRPTQTL